MKKTGFKFLFLITLILGFYPRRDFLGNSQGQSPPSLGGGDLTGTWEPGSLSRPARGCGTSASHMSCGSQSQMAETVSVWVMVVSMTSVRVPSLV